MILGAKALVDGFQQVGARATGLVNDTTSGMGSGDPSYPYDPAGDVHRRQPQSQALAAPLGAAQPAPSSAQYQAPVAVREAEDRNGGTIV